MNTYPTADLPLGTTSAKALYNNASNFDEALNAQSPAWIDRFGKRRETWFGLEQLFAQFLVGLGYESTYVVYGAGAVVSRQTQLVQRLGELYRVTNASDLPLTLTGDWATDGPKFTAVGDAALRSALAAANGVSLIGNAAGTVSTHAAMLALPTPVNGRVYTTLGYYAAGDGGHAMYRYDDSSGLFKMMRYDRPSARQFGLKCDGGTDDSAAFNAAMLTFGVKGGVMRIDDDAQVYIASTVTIPPNCHVEGPHKFAGSGKDNTFTGWADLGGAFIVNAAATITVSGGATLSGCVIRREGQVFPAYMPTGYAGTAVTLIGDDATVYGNIALGFNKFLYSTGCQRMDVLHNRFDCTNGVEITQNGDVGHIMFNHGWPFITTPHPDASFNPDTSYRAGTAYYFHDLCDFTQVTNNFQFGYSIGYDTLNASNITFTGNVNDGFGDVGMRVRTGCNGIRIIGGFAPTSDVGLEIGCDGFNVKVLGMDFENNSTCAINVISGDPTILGCHWMNTPNGVYISGIASKILIDDCSSQAVTDCPIKFVNLNHTTTIGENMNWGDWGNTASPIQGNQGLPTISATDPLLPPTFGKIVKVSGAFGNIGTMRSGFVNRKITLVFDSPNTIISSVGNVNSIRCPNNTNIAVAAGSAITLVHTGGNWQVTSVAL